MMEFVLVLFVLNSSPTPIYGFKSEASCLHAADEIRKTSYGRAVCVPLGEKKPTAKPSVFS